MHETPNRGPAPRSIPPVRIALWALLAGTLVLILALGAVHLLRRSAAGGSGEPLPVLGQAPELALTDSRGRTVTLDDLAGTPAVVDFVFTRCVTSCPILTARMATLGEGLTEGRHFRRVSVSVDPAHDTPEVLAEFKEARDVPEEWLFLTGEPAEVLGLVRDGFHLAVEPDSGNPVDPIVHSTRLVLLDARGRIRGYYDGLDTDEVERLDRDLRRLAGG